MSNFKRALTRFGLRIARNVLPVVHIKKDAFVLRDADVREILNRDTDFTLRELNKDNIDRHLGGDFLLSLDAGPALKNDQEAMRRVVRKEDPDRIREFVRTIANETLHHLKTDRPFDCVDPFTRLIPLRMIGDYLGTPGPNDADMLHWNRTLFNDIFLNLSAKPEVRAAAEQPGRELKAYLDERIQQIHAALATNTSLPDNLLTRLVQQQSSDGPKLDDAAIQRNMMGTLLGAVEPISKATCSILNQFFLRPEVLAKATKAAADYDMETLQTLAFEALRFQPNLPVILRYAAKEQRIGAKDGKKGKRIKAGSRVFAMINAAMFDPETFPRPNEFREDRSLRNYLHFGLGLHRCYGQYVNYIMIPEMLGALLRLPKLRQAEKIEMAGTFPGKWILQSS